jgi:hypothetical protein
MADLHWGIPVLIMLVFIFYLNAYSEMEPFLNVDDSEQEVTTDHLTHFKYDRASSHSVDTSSDTLVEDFANFYKKCDAKEPKGILKDIFDTYEIYKTRGDKWELFLPCNYTEAERELRTSTSLHTQDTLLPNGSSSANAQPKAIFAVDGCDQLVSKNRLWILLTKAYGHERSGEYMPPTYVFGHPGESRRFLEDYTPGAMYICKKNIQRKEGLLRTRNLDLILRSQVEGYKVVQRYLTDVYTIRKRKLNLRYYVLIVCDHHGHKRAYIHREGKCLYTAKDYDAESEDEQRHITSTGVTAEDYKKHQLPLNIAELRAHMHANDRMNYDEVFTQVCKKMQYVVEAVMPSMCVNHAFRHHLRFQLFGADVLFTSNLEPYLLELNKGPNMKPINQTDYALKRIVLEDTFKHAGFLPVERSSPSGFILLSEMDVNNIGTD